ncbi:hypothetical protein ACI77I_17065 [Pseudomonas sp. D47]|uniref:hypothetical protein n=1 Tax=Pseudomonas sp. D47 TaxID=3159447 RepID=UPI00387B6F2A
MRELMAGTPSVCNTINQMLQEHLQLDDERTGVGFFATGKRGAARLSMTEACLYQQQRPTLDPRQIPEGKTLYLPPHHRLTNYTRAILFDELKTLNLEQAIKDNWRRYLWTQRATHSPLSWRAKAGERYKIHFEASGLTLLAQGNVQTPALQPLLALFHPPAPGPEGHKDYAEQIFLTLATASTLTLPGAWVLTRDGNPPVSQRLYLPTQAPAWRCFAQRIDMERWLLDHQQTLFSTIELDPQATIGYRVDNTPPSPRSTSCHGHNPNGTVANMNNVQCFIIEHKIYSWRPPCWKSATSRPCMPCAKPTAWWKPPSACT